MARVCGSCDDRLIEDSVISKCAGNTAFFLSLAFAAAGGCSPLRPTFMGSTQPSAGTTGASTPHSGSSTHAQTLPALTASAQAVFATGGTSVSASVSSSENRLKVSPYIYGYNDISYYSPRTPASLTLRRYGGNRWTTYNWENNASNAGSDYGPHSSDGFLGSSTIPGEGVRSRVQSAQNGNNASLITVPVLDYVAADKLGNVTEVASSTSTRWISNQMTSPAAPSQTPSTSDRVVYQNEFVSFVERTFPSAHSDPQREIFYSLDNEPGLWSDTHPMLHPNPTRYDEMATRTVHAARMIKNIAPRAQVFGAVTYGFYEMENLQDAPDAAGRNYIDFILSTWRQAEVSAGQRLVDVLDIHWYPEARSTDNVRVTTVNTSNPSNAVVDARLQTPRSLWDPTYSETSWIRDYVGGPIQLLTTLKQRIARHYPGTKIAITEYDYGGLSHISGGLTQADVLGVFAREGVFAATHWNESSRNNAAYLDGAFDLYVNYDGALGKVGDVSVKAVTTDNANLSIFAFASDLNSELQIIAINKSRNPLSVDIPITHSVQLNRADVYQLNSLSTRPVVAGTVAVQANRLKYSLPPLTATTFALSVNGIQ